jgi:uncharacterized membrane protein YdbT with pleckstrin-like domain
MMLEEALVGDEQLIYQAHVHPIKYASAMLFTFLGLACFSLSAKYHVRPPILSYCGMILLLVALWHAGVAYILIRSSEFAVTDRRVIVQMGTLSRRTIEIFLMKVEGISINQTLLGRIFNFGDINIRGGGIEEQFKMMEAPYQFKRQVEKNADAIAKSG